MDSFSTKIAFFFLYRTTLLIKGLLLLGGQRKARVEGIIMMVCSHNFLHLSVRYPEVVRLFTAILAQFRMFTAILDFLYPGKKPGQHTEYLRKYIFCSLLSRKAALVMTNISDLGTLILKLRAQLLVSPWHHDPGTRHVTHPAHDIMRNTPNVFK